MAQKEKERRDFDNVQDHNFKVIQSWYQEGLNPDHNLTRLRDMCD